MSWSKCSFSFPCNFLQKHTQYFFFLLFCFPLCCSSISCILCTCNCQLKSKALYGYISNVLNRRSIVPNLMLHAIFPWASGKRSSHPFAFEHSELTPQITSMWQNTYYKASIKKQYDLHFLKSIWPITDKGKGMWLHPLKWTPEPSSEW